MDHSWRALAKGPARSIVETAIASGKLTMFVAGLEASGLIEVLRAKGPFTVFAPTDRALNKLPAGTFDTLLRNTTVLLEVLNYHVITGNVPARDLIMGDVMTLQGSPFLASASPDIRVNGSRVTRADIVATNGIIHAIDAVMVPRHLQLLAIAA